MLLACDSRQEYRGEFDLPEEILFEEEEEEPEVYESPKDSLPMVLEESDFYYEDTEMSFSAKKYQNRITLWVHLDLDDSLEIPEIRSDFGGISSDIAPVFGLAPRAYLLNEEGKEISRVDGVSSFTHRNNSGSAEIEFGSENLRSLTVGKHHLQLKLVTNFANVHDTKSSIQPLKALFSFDFEIDSIYKSTVYFKKLVLNKEFTEENQEESNPDSGLEIFWRDLELIYAFKKSSLSLTSNDRASFYHNSLTDTLDIKAFEKNYFFSDDPLSDTSMTVESLLNREENIPLIGTDELLIYCKTKGVVNADF